MTGYYKSGDDFELSGNIVPEHLKKLTLFGKMMQYSSLQNPKLMLNSDGFAVRGIFRPANTLRVFAQFVSTFLRILKFTAGIPVVVTYEDVALGMTFTPSVSYAIALDPRKLEG